MTSIDVFYQGEEIREIAHFEAKPDHSLAAIKVAIIEKHGLDKETLIYLEDRYKPVDESCLLRYHVGHAGIKAHLHRCGPAASRFTVLLHTLPASRPASQIWRGAQTNEQVEDRPAYEGMLKSGVPDRCGVTLPAGKAVGAPFASDRMARPGALEA